MNKIPPHLMTLVLGSVPVLIAVGYFISRKAISKQHYRAARQKKLAATLHSLLCRHGLEGLKTDSLPNRFIGLDRERRKLLWIDQNSPAPQSWCLDLAERAACTLVVTQEPSLRGIKDIFLELRPGTAVPPLRLYFFRDGRDRAQEKAALFRKAKGWNQRIRQVLKAGTTTGEQAYTW